MKIRNSRLTIPNLTQGRIPTSIRALGPRTRQIRHRPKSLRQYRLNVHQRVRSSITRHNPRCRQPFICRHRAIPRNGRLEEIDHVLVQDVLRAVAGKVKGAVASGVFGEFVGPEIRVDLALGDPVFVHVGEEVVAAKGFKEGANVGAVVGSYVGGVAVGGGIVLSAGKYVRWDGGLYMSTSLNSLRKLASGRSIACMSLSECC